METYFSENAKKDLDGMTQDLRVIFIKHVEKIFGMPPRRHMKYGVPFYVEDVTKQARLIYQMSDESLQIIRCFKSHKEYERWYKSYK